jgi:hypothetical protein
VVQTTTGKRATVDEATVLVPSDVVVAERPIGEEPYRYVFRSLAGKYLNDLDHHLDVPDPKWEEPDDLPELKRWARMAKANWLDRNKDEALRAALEQAYFDTRGTGKVVFRYRRGANGMVGTVTYGTDSDAIATALRADIKRGKLPFIAEIDQSRFIKVGEKKYANTDLGRALAFDEITRNGGNLEVVEK